MTGDGRRRQEIEIGETLDLKKYEVSYPCAGRTFHPTSSEFGEDPVRDTS